MAVTVRVLDPTDTALLDATQAGYEETEQAVDPDGFRYGRAEYEMVLRNGSPEVFTQVLLAYDEDELLGHALLQARSSDNTHLADARAWVPPRHGGRGAGTALLAAAQQWAQDRGRSVLTTEMARDGDLAARSLAWARRRGFVPAEVEEERRLPLPVPQQVWDDLAAQAAEHHTAYRLLVVHGPVPGELAESYCDTYNRLRADAPSGDVPFEATRRTPELLEARWTSMRAAGGDQVVSLALDAQGEVVGLCNVIANAGDEHLYQGSTIVRAEHRGHRLGLGLKVAAYRAAQDVFADRSHVVTWNDDANTPMIAVNEALGFQLRGARVALTKTL